MRLVTFGRGASKLHFIFGPYRERVPGTFGVRLTEDRQLNMPCDLHFPIEDFGIPSARELEDFLIEIITVAQDGQVPYVGCYGGIGRTGMIVAALARTLVITDDPVGWARTNYLGHAVETREQRHLVATFDANRVREATFRHAVASAAAAPNSVPQVATKRLQLAALWDTVKAHFGNARRQAGDASRK